MEHPTPLGAIRSLGENGIHPVAIIIRSAEKFASQSRYSQKVHYVDNHEEAYELLMREYGNIQPRPFVITCDDTMVDVLDHRYSEMKDRFYVASTAEGNLSHYMNKWVLCDLAARHGLNVARSWPVKRGEIPDDLVYPIITKPLTSYVGWKNDYRICANEEELKQAYREVKGTEFMLQQYIKKVNELCLDGAVANHGKRVFVSMASTYTYILPDYYSMEMVIKDFDDAALQSALEAMFEEVGYEGIFTTEFMIDAEGRLWFLEINFRNSGWSYASTKLGMNLPLLWAESCLTGDIPEEARKPIPENYIALDEVKDFIHRVMRKKQIGVWQWIKGVRQADCLFCWNKQDKKPTIVYWFTLGVRVIKNRLFRHKE